jgi:NhaA family Na+:H+ antiporter
MGAPPAPLTLGGRPLERFLRIEAASGIVLLVVAAIALAWANSPWASSYVALWHTPLGVRVGARSPSSARSSGGQRRPHGDLLLRGGHGDPPRDAPRRALRVAPRRAPAAAALGGMVAPARSTWLRGRPATRSGWGVPMATDIAFAWACSRCSASACPRPCACSCSRWRSSTTSGPSWSSRSSTRRASRSRGSGWPRSACGLVFAMQRFGVRQKARSTSPRSSCSGRAPTPPASTRRSPGVIGLITPVRAWRGADGLRAGVSAELDRHRRARGAPSPHDLAKHAASTSTWRAARRCPRREPHRDAPPLGGLRHHARLRARQRGRGLGRRSLALDAARARRAGAAVGLLVGKPSGSSSSRGLRCGSASPRCRGPPPAAPPRARRGGGHRLHHGPLHRAARVHRRALLGAAKLGVLAASGS